MRRRLQLIPILLILFNLVIVSCKKDNTVDSTHSFNWNYANVNYKAGIDTAYTTSMSGGPTIIAGLGTRLTSIGPGPRIILTSFMAGIYRFGQTNTNRFIYIDHNEDEQQAIDGSINITNNANNLLSGNFSVTLIDPLGVKRPLTGSFNNVSIRF